MNCRLQQGCEAPEMCEELGRCTALLNTPPALPDEAGEVIVELKRFANWSGGGKVEETCERAIKLIERLAARWISVEERLPDDGHHVLVFNVKNLCSYTAYVRKGHWYHACGNETERYELYPSNWQELPVDPPQKGST